MKILTAAEMAETDRRTIEAGVPMATLMENAGAAVAQFVMRVYFAGRRVLVICGKGNNGGDGLVAARLLAEAGRDVSVALLAAEADFKDEAAARALERLRQAAPEVKVCVLGMLELDGFDVIIDAVVGTGFKPPLRGVAALVRDKLATMTTPVVAVDVPSGWDADSMRQDEPGAFRADAVVTFTAPKLAHVFGHLTPGNVFGPVVVAEIGSSPQSSDSLITSATKLHWTGAAKAIAETPRTINSNKGMYGHVLLIAGSYGTAGAPAMAALAALRAGAGLVTAAVPQRVMDLVAAIAPELMMKPLDEGPEGAVALSNLKADALAALLKKTTVIAIGPGLSTRGEASEFVRELVVKTRLPMVLDADALNAFEGRAQLLNGEGRTIVLTPHPGEFSRLTGLTVKQIEADRLNLARSFAVEHQVTLVLKGWRTLVAHPDGQVGVNTTGNPSMAKGGSGDILTGIVGAMMAQYPREIARAVEAAVYLHGLAADFAAHAMDEHTVLATDTVAHLSDAFRYRVADGDGHTWLTGLHR